MKTNGESTLERVTCFGDVPERDDAVDPSCGSELAPGFMLDGRFRVAEVVSRGGMATIYRAEDARQENRTVALKVPHLQYESDPNFFVRFQREEQIGLMLNHPYLLRFVRVEEKSRPYIVTEFLQGRTLAHLMNAMRPLPEKDALKIAGLVCEALQHMHEQGAVHRDLKPDNIMICRDRGIRLMDFGIATAENARRVTMAGISPAFGTPDYMAPEQVKSRRSDYRTDIYAMGAILYEMLTGVVPFQNDNPWVSMNNRVSGDPEAPRKLNPNLSPQAEEIVLHAMQRDPAKRFATAAAMKAELDAPEAMEVTGYCNRLQKPRWKFGFRETPMLAGTVAGVTFVLGQILLFLLLRHFHPGR